MIDNRPGATGNIGTALWQEVETLARSLPGFRPMGEWRREIESRITAA